MTPTLLSRLRTLSSLHSSANNFETDLGELESKFRGIGERHLEMDEILRNVEGSLKSNRELVDRNLKGIEERLEGLGKRIEGL